MVEVALSSRLIDCPFYWKKFILRLREQDLVFRKAESHQKIGMLNEYLKDFSAELIADDTLKVRFESEEKLAWFILSYS